MNEFYLFLVIILFCLAIADLIVGVSNDAVNFLNSAIGSNVAPRIIIMIVASIGIFIGATFSSGIMEVARKGIFNPDHFMFSEVMVIFAAVMLTDIILLDFFNTLSLPTSTTVSIVFELLGAAVVISLIKISNSGDSIDQIGNYINSSRALTIIGGILLSIVFAFLLGMIIQFISRLLFTFQYKNRMKYVGAVWSGFALTALTYFMLIKGIKGASFVTDEQISWFQSNSYMIMGLSFVFWTIILQALYSFFRVNILKVIVLFGTFGLAMAFAGNDLVNFIGVPIAGFESFLFWKDSGIAANEFLMAPLSNPVQTPTYLLLIAGFIMVGTLLLSKKARSVTETEVNLGRQFEGFERFKPNVLSRGIVRGGRIIGKFFLGLLPDRLLSQAEVSFNSDDNDDSEENNETQVNGAPAAAFDLVRASVNLTVAGILIAFATSLKLPLSTTYVSFMVAMGTSLSDRAWGRDSAVYRVSGVLNVIGGWFLTAFIAFMVSGIFALLIYHFELYAIVILLILSVILVINGIKYHRRKELEKQKHQELVYRTDKVLAQKAVDESRSQVVETIEIVRRLYREVVKGVVTEKRKVLQKVTDNIENLNEQHNLLRKNLYSTIKRIDEEKAEISRIYLRVYNLERDLVSAIRYITDAGLNHVENVHKSLLEDQQEHLLEVRELFSEYIDLVIATVRDEEITNFEGLLGTRKDLEERIDNYMETQVVRLKKEKYGSKNTLLYLDLLLETKNLVSISGSFIKLLRKVQIPPQYQ